MKRLALAVMLIALTSCSTFKEIRLDVKEPVSIRILSEKDYIAEWGKPGPYRDDRGNIQTRRPRCFFRPSERIIFVNSMAGTECLLHELAHAAGKTDLEAAEINGWR